MLAASTQGPKLLDDGFGEAARIAASSHGGLVMWAIAPCVERIAVKLGHGVNREHNELCRGPFEAIFVDSQTLDFRVKRARRQTWSRCFS